MGNETSQNIDTVTILKSTVEDYKHQMSILQDEINDLKTSNHEKQKKIEELNQSTYNKFLLFNENDQLKSELRQLKEEHKEIHTYYKREMNRIMNGAFLSSTENNKLKSELSQLKEKHEEIHTDYKREMNRIMNEASLSSNENNKLKFELSQLKEEHKEIQIDYKRKMNRIMTEASVSSNENNKLKSELSQLKEKHKEIHTDYKREMNRIMNEALLSSTENNKLKSELSQLKEKHEEIHTDYKREMNRIMNEASLSSNENNKLKFELSQLKEEHKEIQIDYKRKMNRIMNEALLSSTENNKLKSELSQLKEKHEEIHTDYKREMNRIMNETSLSSNENNKLKSMQKENEDYRSIPIIKEILNIYSRMKTFHEKLNEAMNANDINDERQVFEDKITEVTNDISYLKQELKNNNIGKSFEETLLKRAETEMNMLKQFSIQKQKERKTKLSKMASKIKSAATQLDDIIPTAMNNINMEINNYEQELLELETSRPEFDERNKCSLQTVLALHMDRRDQMMELISSNKTADSGLTDNEEFHIILQNVKEEYQDFVNIKDKVLLILNLFTTIDSQFVRVHRIGKPNIQNIRPIMVSSSTPRLLSLLQHKNETKNTPFGEIRIRPYCKGPKTKKYDMNNY